MKLLAKMAITLALIFASTFFMIKMSGILTIDDINQGFESLRSGPAYIIGVVVAALLFADLFIAIPDMTVILLAGYALGFPTALAFSLAGVFLAAITGYTLSRILGDRVLRKIEPDEKSRQQTYALFQRHGIWVLILSRATPLLPEVSACLAGACKMPLHRFLLGWSLGTVPYLIVVTYSGSISDVDKLSPAIFTAITVTGMLWAAWVVVLRKTMVRRTK